MKTPWHWHDTVEDTNVTREQIAEEFGWKVFKLVVELTDVTNEDGNRATRKAIEAKRLGMASKEAQTIKLADLLTILKQYLNMTKFGQSLQTRKIACWKLWTKYMVQICT